MLAAFSKQTQIMATRMKMLGSLGSVAVLPGRRQFACKSTAETTAVCSQPSVHQKSVPVLAASSKPSAVPVAAAAAAPVPGLMLYDNQEKRGQNLLFAVWFAAGVFWLYIASQVCTIMAPFIFDYVKSKEQSMVEMGLNMVMDSRTNSSSSSVADAAQQHKLAANGSRTATNKEGSEEHASAMAEIVDSMLRMRWIENEKEKEKEKENGIQNEVEMKSILYPELPKSQWTDWDLDTPQIKKRMANTLEKQSARLPHLMSLIYDMKDNQGLMKTQFEHLKIKPEDISKKLMANDKVAAALKNLGVQAALIDVARDPMNIEKYHSDTEVMAVLKYLAGLLDDNVAEIEDEDT